MSVQFRPHRGSLADSLAETVIIHDHNHLVTHLRSECNYLNFESDDITVEDYGLGIDERCGWNTILFVLREWQLVLQMEWFNGNFQYYSKKLS